jgi:hypothetical protein
MGSPTPRHLIVFCQAYPYVEACFHIFSKYPNESKTIVIVSDKNLLRFWSLVKNNGIVERLNIVFLGIKINYNHFNLFHLLREKRKIIDCYNLYFKHVKNSSIYYFDDLYDIVSLSIIKNISRKNKVYFTPTNRIGVGKSTNKISIKDAIILIEKIFISNILLGYNKAGDTLKIRASKYYFKKLNIERINFDSVFRENKYKRHMQKLISDQYAFNKKLFIFTQYDVLSGKVTLDNYNRFINEINPVLKGLYFKKEIFIKHHPQFLDEGINNIFGEVFPRYIPAETIDLTDKVVLGLSSYSLISAIKKNKPKLVVSLLNLIDFNSENYKLYQINLLMKESDSICFPKTVHELVQLLQNM